MKLDSQRSHDKGPSDWQSNVTVASDNLVRTTKEENIGTSARVEQATMQLRNRLFRNWSVREFPAERNLHR